MKKPLASLHETAVHGKTSFPFSVYHGRIPEWLGGFPLHWHEEFEIILVTFGRGIISVAGESFLCREGDIVMVPPEKIHSIESSGKNKFAYYNILFDLSFLEENPDSICSKRFLSKFENCTSLSSYHLKKKSQLNERLFPLVKDLTPFWEQDEIESALLIKARLFEILYVIRNEAAVSDPGKSSKAKSERLKKTLSFVKENFFEKISVRDAAKNAGLSPSRFMKVFREDTGRSFVQYLNDYRLELSAEELCSTDKSVTEIAENAGFESLSYFILLFKRKFSCPPNEYRASMKKRP